MQGLFARVAQYAQKPAILAAFGLAKPSISLDIGMTVAAVGVCLMKRDVLGAAINSIAGAALIASDVIKMRKENLAEQPAPTRAVPILASPQYAFRPQHVFAA